MTVIVFNILALLLMLPLQTVSYLKVLTHLVEYRYEGAHKFSHQDYTADVDKSALVDEVPHVVSEPIHQHGPDQHTHSHCKNIWGLFANQGLGSNASTTDFEALFFFVHPPSYTYLIITENLYRGLFRPPIA